MQNLINFIIKNVHWLLFLLLVLISTFFIVNTSSFQRSKFLVLQNEVAGRVYNLSSFLISYIGLKSENEKLIERVAVLENQNLSLKNYITENSMLEMLKDSSFLEEMEHPEYEYICAQVINNNISGMDNLITLNKGSLSGVKPDMGVISSNGVVGIVMRPVSRNFSRVNPILSSKFKLSSKVKGSNYSGLLSWDGTDPRYAYLMELPRHAEFTIGDTIVTTGYSSVFPEGKLIGVVEDFQKQKNDNFNMLKVKLFADFSTMQNVIVIDYKQRKERLDLEEETKKSISKVGGSLSGN